MEDLQRVAAQVFNPEEMNLAVIGPFNSEGKFLKLIKA
jgi:predicted Zn-dependent peptidase